MKNLANYNPCAEVYVKPIIRFLLLLNYLRQFGLLDFALFKPATAYFETQVP